MNEKVMSKEQPPEDINALNISQMLTKSDSFS